MKRVISVLLVLCMLLLLTACGEVSNVQKLINRIGEITLESGESIQLAREAFDALTEEQKDKVKNREVLEQAEAQLLLKQKEKTYSDAEIAFNSADYEQAIILFSEISDFSDAAEKVKLSEKAKHYQLAEKAFSEADYKTATAEFKSAGDYKDAKEQAQKAEWYGYYAEGNKLFDSGNYTAAANMFVKAKGFDDVPQKILDSGKELINKKKYSDAVDVLAMVTSPLKSEATKYSEYAQGFNSFNTKDYDSAEKHFKSAGNTLDAGDMMNASILMQAETNIGNGYLNTAKRLYEKLPEEYSYNDISVGSRLATLEKYDAFVEICGIWSSSSMDGSVRQTHKSTGLWDQWDAKGSGYELEVTCVINNDDTVTIKAKANFWHYTNYSSLSKALKTTNDYCTFNYTGKTVPTKMDYSLDFTYEYRGTLTIKNDSFKLDYSIVDRNSSMYFTYTYKSFGTYDTLKKKL